MQAADDSVRKDIFLRPVSGIRVVLRSLKAIWSWLPFLVQIGSMAVVMRSAAEALSQFDMYVVIRLAIFGSRL